MHYRDLKVPWIASKAFSMSFGGNRRWVPWLMDEKIGKQAPFTSQPASHVTSPHVQVALSSSFSPLMNPVHGLRIEVGRNP